MKKSILPLILLLSMVLLSSCAPVYIPNAVNVPLNSNRGELQIGGHAGSNGFDLQTSYAITKEIAVMLNGSTMNRTDDSTNSSYHKHSFGEAAIGYYNSFDQAGRFEVFAGYGLGSSSALTTYELFSPLEVTTKGKYGRIFIQPSIGTSTKFFDGALSLRSCYVHFYDIEGNGITLTENQNGLFIEPTLTARIGYKNVKLSTQLGVSLPVQRDQWLDYEPFMVSVGLHVNFGKK